MNKGYKTSSVLLLTLIFILPINIKAQGYKRPIRRNNVKGEESYTDSNVKKRVKLKYNDRGLSVLMYHSIGYEKNNDLKIPKEQFKEQMKYLKNNGYNTLTIKEFYDFLTVNKPIPEKSLLITFDDGYLDNYKYAFPILKEYGLRATFFIVTNTIDKDSNCLNSAQLKEMDFYGMDIQSHTLNHEELNKLSYERQLKTLKDSKEKLEELLGKNVYSIAYPYGKYNENTIKAANTSGYKLGFTTGGRVVNKNTGIYKLRRIYVNPNEEMNIFRDKIAK